MESCKPIAHMIHMIHMIHIYAGCVLCSKAHLMICPLYDTIVVWLTWPSYLDSEHNECVCQLSGIELDALNHFERNSHSLTGQTKQTIFRTT